MFRAVLFTTAKNWESIPDKWKKKIWNLHTTEYYSAIPFIADLTQVEDTILSQISQTTKTNISCSPLYVEAKIQKTTTTKKTR